MAQRSKCGERERGNRISGTARVGCNPFPSTPKEKRPSNRMISSLRWHLPIVPVPLDAAANLYRPSALPPHLENGAGAPFSHTSAPYLSWLFAGAGTIRKNLLRQKETPQTKVWGVLVCVGPTYCSGPLPAKRRGISLYLSQYRCRGHELRRWAQLRSFCTGSGRKHKQL